MSQNRADAPPAASPDTGTDTDTDNAPTPTSPAKAAWTPERRAAQAAWARATQPWKHATGPRSVDSKARSSLNALKHGARSRAHHEARETLRSSQAARTSQRRP